MPEIWSGVFEGKTDGTSIGILFRNTDQRSHDYGDIKDKYRPGHADFTFDAKYGFRDYRGGGRSSAARRSAASPPAPSPRSCWRSTASASSATSSRSATSSPTSPDPTAVTLEQVEATPVRCPDPAAAAADDRADRGSAQGPGFDRRHLRAGGDRRAAGLGEPVFDKLKADLAKALLSLPAVMAFEYGAGFAVATAPRQRRTTTLFVPQADRPASAPRRTATAACWAASAAASRSSAAWPSSRRAACRGRSGR